MYHFKIIQATIMISNSLIDPFSLILHRRTMISLSEMHYRQTKKMHSSHSNPRQFGGNAVSADTIAIASARQNKFLVGLMCGQT